jgi:predicted nucleic-acid-binding protein
MIGLDTNILVRFITQDDPQQSILANEIFRTRLAETSWVLGRSYRLSDVEVAAAIERVLQTDNLVVENEQAVFAAMIALKEGLGTFADALIGALGANAGFRHTLTFDRGAKRLLDFPQP